MNVQQAGDIIAQVTFWACWVFSGLTSMFWPWWKTQLGWSIQLKTIAIGLALLPSQLMVWLGPVSLTRWPWLQWFAVSAVAAIPLILAWRFIVIYRYQRTGRRPRRHT